MITTDTNEGDPCETCRDLHDEEPGEFPWVWDAIVRITIVDTSSTVIDSRSVCKKHGLEIRTRAMGDFIAFN